MSPPFRSWRQFLMSRFGLVLAGFLAVAGYFLWTEHQAHVIAALPWILVGGCLLMHVFMHRGHGAHGGHDSAASRDSTTPGLKDDGRREP